MLFAQGGIYTLYLPIYPFNYIFTQFLVINWQTLDKDLVETMF